MNEHVEPNLFQILRWEGPFGFLVVAFSVFCTLWLLTARIRGCFRSQRPKTGRDLVFLFSGPMTSLLYAAMKGLVATQSYVRGGIDAEFPLIYGLGGAATICSIAFLGFVLGVIAFALPSKFDATIE